MVRTPVLQFGTSRFLQAHVDLFISEAMAAGQDVGPITVVQSSGHAGRAERLAALTRPFPVRIQGLQAGKRMQKEVIVRSIARCLSTTTGWTDVCQVFVEEAEIILSNTGDAGFTPAPQDGGDSFEQAMSYPAKLTLLLQARFFAHGRPVQIMPLELVSRNGDVLKGRVLELAQSRGSEFTGWLNQQVVWVNSLVDRIVSEPLEPAGAVAEPYALWAVEKQPKLILPCRHDAIQVVERLDDIAALKLYILNLGHTVMADQWQRAAGPQNQTVKDFMEQPRSRAALEKLYMEEIMPGFEAAGVGPDARAYLATTLERFANPFLEHRIADIAQNHPQKIARRITAFCTWAAGHGDQTSRSALQAIISRAKDTTS